ncbi:ATP binding protein, putative [Ricinus communis]|uniref:ATP binding protein, putative n=1 Tax=Ricinus communis TaxID=3988 RepID=B9SE33_RICCO|nr:ATP binding protein, putative [Ricinus communis]
MLTTLAGMVSVFPSEKKRFHTTRSWDFMGFYKNSERTCIESNIIVGVLDTGIWPEYKSFDDKRFGAPPKKWKGSCQISSNFTSCNNKIIGARYYRAYGNFGEDDFLSPRDSRGHGTHTAPTAAGNSVNKASLVGLGYGTARGAVPSARIAVYKISFDDAIADGVDIISLSVGRFYPKDYLNDAIAIGAFHAMKNGILKSNSAGNSGSDPTTLSNFSPWSLTVAATTIDRKFLTKGISVNTFDLNNKMYPVIYGGNAPNRKEGFSESTSRYCLQDSLDKTLVKGKIVLCDSINNGEAATAAEAVGTMMQDGYFRDTTFVFPLPASHSSSTDGSDVSEYVNKTRGPNPLTSDILKPDLAAPGVDILAAWTR